FLGRGHDADPAQRMHPGLARRDVLGPQAVIDGEAAVERVERLTGTGAEPTAPHLMRGGGRRGRRRRLRRPGGHQSAAAPTSRCWRAASRPAPIRTERPYRWMNPSASCWSYTLSLPNVAYDGWYSANGLSRPATARPPL